MLEFLTSEANAMETLTYDKDVLNTLRQFKSLALMELSSILGMNVKLLSMTVNELEQKGLVKVTGKDVLLNQIVTPTTKALQDVQ